MSKPKKSQVWFIQTTKTITMVLCLYQLCTDDLIQVVPVILCSTPGSPTITMGRFGWGSTGCWRTLTFQFLFGKTWFYMIQNPSENIAPDLDLLQFSSERFVAVLKHLDEHLQCLNPAFRHFTIVVPVGQNVLHLCLIRTSPFLIHSPFVPSTNLVFVPVCRESPGKVFHLLAINASSRGGIESEVPCLFTKDFLSFPLFVSARYCSC